MEQIIKYGLTSEQLNYFKTNYSNLYLGRVIIQNKGQHRWDKEYYAYGCPEIKPLQTLDLSINFCCQYIVVAADNNWNTEVGNVKIKTEGGCREYAISR